MSSFVDEDCSQGFIAKLAQRFALISQPILLAPNVHRGYLDGLSINLRIQCTNLTALEPGDWIIDGIAGYQNSTLEWRGLQGSLNGLPHDVHRRQPSALRKRQDAIEWTFRGDIGVQLVQGLDIAGGARRIKVSPIGGIGFGNRCELCSMVAPSAYHCNALSSKVTVGKAGR